MIRIDALEEALSDVMAGYDAEARAAVARAVDRTGRAVSAEIKRHAMFKDRTGHYRKAFTLKRAGGKRTKYSTIWHVKAPYYRLTHLLEYGHANQDGSRSRAFPHIVYGERLARGMLPEEIEKELTQ